MSRIVPVAASTPNPPEAEAIAAIRAAWGGVPRLGLVFARSLAATRATLALGEALSHGTFGGAVAEQIAIAVANENRCPYCLAAHTAAGRARGLDETALSDARRGSAPDAKTAAALTFVQSVVRERGHVGDAELDAVRAAGWTEGDLVELVAHAISNTLTNYLHHLSKVPLDFPSVEFATETRAQEAA